MVSAEEEGQSERDEACAFDEVNDAGAFRELIPGGEGHRHEGGSEDEAKEPVTFHPLAGFELEGEEEKESSIVKAGEEKMAVFIHIPAGEDGGSGEEDPIGDQEPSAHRAVAVGDGELPPGEGEVAADEDKKADLDPAVANHHGNAEGRKNDGREAGHPADGVDRDTVESEGEAGAEHDARLSPKGCGAEEGGAEGEHDGSDDGAFDHAESFDIMSGESAVEDGGEATGGDNAAIAFEGILPAFAKKSGTGEGEGKEIHHGEPDSGAEVTDDVVVSVAAEENEAGGEEKNTKTDRPDAAELHLDSRDFFLSERRGGFFFRQKNGEGWLFLGKRGWVCFGDRNFKGDGVWDDFRFLLKVNLGFEIGHGL